MDPRSCQSCQILQGLKNNLKGTFYFFSTFIRRPFFSPPPAGFTLVEVLVAVAILSTGILLVIETMARSQQGLRIAENLILSSQIAEEKILEEEWNVRQYHKLPTGTTGGKETYPGKTFAWSRTVETYSDETLEGEDKLNRVSVTLDWKEGMSRENELTLETLILNREKKLME